MKHRLKTPCLLLPLLLVACGCKPVESAASEQASVKNFVPAFKNNPAIHEVHGVRIDVMGVLYADYYVYTAPRWVVLAGVEAIVPDTTKSYYVPGEHVAVYTDSLRFAPEQRNEQNQFFWRYEKLKQVKVYKCTKPPFAHTLIFDAKSDTVYHYISELAD